MDGLPAELYRRFPLTLKRHLAARLWDIAIGKTDVPPNWANLVHTLYKKGNCVNPDNWRPIVCATTEAKLIWMLILRRVAPAVYRAIPPTMWGAIPGRSPLEAIFMQDAVVDMDPISLIITSLDVKGAFPNTLHRLLQAVWKHMGLPSQGFLQAYLATGMYAVKTDVGTTPWIQPASGVPQGGAEGPFLFLLVTLPLASYIRRTYPDVTPYPLRIRLLAFAEDMEVVTATARQPVSTTPDPSRATGVLQAATTYLEGNQLLVHNVKSATMVHNAPPPPLRPGDPPMNPVSTATYLAVQQAASANGVTLPLDLIRQLTRTLIIARIVALSTQAMAYFLQAVLNAAIGFQALQLTLPQHMLQAAATTVRQAWTIHGHRPTSLPAAVHAASPPYYGDNTDHLVNNAYTAHTAAHLHCLMHNHEPEVREVFTLTVREAQYHRNTCPQDILHQRAPPPQGGDPRLEPPATPTTPTPACHPNKPSVQGNRPCGGPTHRCRCRTNGKHHHSGPGGHHPTPRTSHPKPDAGPPTGGHTPSPLPATPGVAQQVNPGKSHAQRSHTSRTPQADRWGSTLGV